MGLSYDPGSRKWNLKPEQETFERKPIKQELTFDIAGYYTGGEYVYGGRGSGGFYQPPAFYPTDPPSGGRGTSSASRATITITVPLNEDANASITETAI